MHCSPVGPRTAAQCSMHFTPIHSFVLGEKCNKPTLEAHQCHGMGGIYLYRHTPAQINDFFLVHTMILEMT